MATQRVNFHIFTFSLHRNISYEKLLTILAIPKPSLYQIKIKISVNVNIEDSYFDNNIKCKYKN